MRLELRRYLRLAVENRDYVSAFTEEPSRSLFDDTVTFQLLWMKMDDRGRTELFYECREDGCSGCGCPLFKDRGIVPDEILEHLKRHVFMHSLR